MTKLASLVRALGRDDRGAAVAEYGMIITTVTAVVIGLMTLGGGLNDCFRSIGNMLAMVTGHS